MKSREIKFRFWYNNKMFYPENLNYFISTNGNNIICAGNAGSMRCPEPYMSYLDNFIIMQFTGIKDKNGKDIYEGDIIKAPAKQKDAICEVFWETEILNSWCIKDKFGFTGLTNFGGEFSPEIIGNIYENTELMKGIV